jgi:hypothetical protein
MISYSAECETTGNYLSIQIILDGVVLAPTVGTQDAFCSDHNDNNIIDGYTTAHYRVPTSYLAGTVHSVRVEGTVVGSAPYDLGRLGDSALLIEK